MKIELSPALEKMVQEKVDAGLYSGPEVVVGEALRLLDSRDRDEELKLQRLRDIVESADRNLAEGKGISFETEQELARFVENL
jgi:antitoxin ParD1/3/4